MKLIVAALLAIPLAVAPAYAANLISDPGFESAIGGAYVNSASLNDGWFADSSVHINKVYPHTGAQYAQLRDEVASGGIKQNVLTTAGAVYTLSFWANSDNAANVLTVTFGGVVVPGLPTFLSDLGVYQLFSTRVVANGASSLLDFELTTPVENFRIDDVSLEQVSGSVPEPVTWATMLVGFGAVGFAMRRRQKIATRLPYVI